jgi:hypothetical protein
MHISTRARRRAWVIFVPILATGAMVWAAAANSATANTATAGGVTTANQGLTHSAPAAKIGKSKPACQDWTGFGQPPNPANDGENEQLNAVAVSGPCDAWTVGSYDINTCSGSQALIAHWTGLTWSLMPSPDPGGCGGNTTLTGIAITKAAVWAVGYYFNGTANEVLVLRLNHGSSTWVRVMSVLNPGGASANNQLSGVTVNGTNVWVVGQYNKGTSAQTLVETANVSSVRTTINNHWTLVKSGNPSGKTGSDVLTGVASSGKDIWAVGDYHTTGPSSALIERCETGPARTPAISYSCRQVSGAGIIKVTAVANRPSAASADRGVLNAVAASSANSAWAVGYAPGPGGLQYLLVQHWNGHAWSHLLVKAPGTQAQFSGVAMLGSQVWAVGSYELGNDSLLEYNDGKTVQWSQLPSPNTGNDQLNAVAADSAGGVWAVGEYGNDSGYTTLAIHN